jgi:Na+-driven multidrug efflux pump
MGIYRQLVAPPLIFFLFAEVFGWGLNGIWWGIFTVTWSAAIVAFFWSRAALGKAERIDAALKVAPAKV